MGYDCYVRNPIIPPPDIRDDWATYDEWREKSHAYFRRNIWGIGALLEDLVTLGMGFEAAEYVELPGWPVPEEFGVEYKEWQDSDGGWHSGWDGPRSDEYRKALDDVLEWHGPEIPGIPIHKFSTNDGWHVTKQECRAALNIYEQSLTAGHQHPDAFRDDFIPFLQAAAEADGFEVY